jgi:hypothetical protein
MSRVKGLTIGVWPVHDQRDERRRGTTRCARVKGLTMAVRLARIGASPPAIEAGPTFGVLDADHDGHGATTMTVMQRIWTRTSS